MNWLKRKESVQDMQSRLWKDGAYATQADLSSPFLTDRMLGRFDFWYYLRVLGVVFEGRAAARRGAFTPDTWAVRAMRILRIGEYCGGRVEIRGVENVANLKTAAVIAANHMSALDTMILPGILVRDHYYGTVVKKSLLTYPLFGVIMRSIDPIALSRRNPREDLMQVLEHGEAFLRAGRSMVLFPQGTRRPRFNPAEFNTLAVKLAARAGVPVIPVALKTDFQGIGRFLRDFGPVRRKNVVRVQFGEPITVSGNGRAEHRRILDFIVKHLSEWGAEVVTPPGKTDTEQGIHQS